MEEWKIAKNPFDSEVFKKHIKDNEAFYQLASLNNELRKRYIAEKFGVKESKTKSTG